MQDDIIFEIRAIMKKGKRQVVQRNAFQGEDEEHTPDVTQMTPIFTETNQINQPTTAHHHHSHQTDSPNILKKPSTEHPAPASGDPRAEDAND